MKSCPYCAEQIQADALKCRYCGEWLEGPVRSRPAVMNSPGGFRYPGTYWNYEYKSETEIFGWPLVHIAQGINPETGMPRVAKGILAIGNIAIGAFALGGLAFGGVSLGGLSLGLVSFGGLALGLLLAAGGFAVSGLLAIGGAAISLAYAIGGLALAPHFLGGNGIDPEFLRLIQEFFPNFKL